jgi:hypothetical protein
MAQNTYTTVTHQGWFSRLGDSIKGVLFGVVLILGSIALLFWNEGQSLQTAQSLEEGEKIVVSVAADAVNEATEGRLVHVGGRAETAETLSDPEFGVALNALRLKRTVEMFQWVEEEKTEERQKIGGGTERVTTYTYTTKWSEALVSSNDFKQPEGRFNPGIKRFESRDWQASAVALGAFTLPADLIGRIAAFEPLYPTDSDRALIPAALSAELKQGGNGFFIGADPASPKVGDLRILFTAVKPQTVTVVARQAGRSFAPFLTEAGGEINMIELGNQTAAQMFSTAKSQNTLLTWGLRVFGFFLCWVGWSLIFNPLKVAADVIPIFGSLIGMGTGLAAFVLAAPISIGTIGIAWVFFRPLIGVPLIILAVALIGGGIWWGVSKKKAAS